jgi:hypothetical protein
VDIDRDFGGYELTQATTVTATLAATGTAATTGEAFLTVQYTPLSNIKDVTS